MKLMLNNTIKKNINASKRASVSIVIGMIVLFSFPVCKKAGVEKKDTMGVITFSIGSVEIVDSEKKVREAMVKDMIKPGELIRTGKESFVTIQVDTVGVVRILADTEASFSALLDAKKDTEISLNKGRIFSKIIKGSGDKYRVKTPTCVVAVRGTEFLTSVGEKRSSVSMYKGVVAVSPNETADREVTVRAGELAKVEPKKDVDISTLSKSQKLNLEKLALHPYIADINTRSTDDINKIFEDLKVDEKSLEKDILDLWNSLSPIEKLRMKGKPLSKIYVRDGNVIMGSVISQSTKKLRVDTGSGVISIPKSDVIRRKMMK
ncbi:MAG: FecR domain-containing protein [bacterium]|nr:FecR domain-containing protein [bacterium]